MKLALSSAAAPDATLSELAAAARRRGLRALELQQGHGHALVPPADTAAVAAAAVLLSEHGIEHVVVRFDALGEASAAAGRLSGLADLALVPAGAAAALWPTIGGVALVREFADPGELVAAASADRSDEAGFGWTVQPGHYDLAAAARAVLAATAGRLRHVRLHGGGPEAVAQEGLGVGALMQELALARFTGVLALAPSDERYRVVWSAWLGRRGGWGCGGKAGERAPLPTAGVEAR